MVFKKILAVVHYSFRASNDQIKVHCHLWKEIFPSMIVFGPWLTEKLEGMRSAMNVPVMKSPYDFTGFNAQVIMLRALQYFNNDFFDGYLYLHDDILVSPKTIASFDLKHIWFCDEREWRAVFRSSPISFSWIITTGIRIFCNSQDHKQGT